MTTIGEAFELPRRLYDETLSGNRGFWLLVGPEGPSRALLEDWQQRFPRPTTRAARAKKAAAGRAKADTANEESDKS